MLDGKCALITGGSTGIGRAIALKLASLGADIVVLNICKDDTTESVAAEIAAMGRRCEVVVANVADPDSVMAAVNSAVEKMEHVDILVNNAGITRDKLMVQMSYEEFTSVLNVNLTGCFNVTKALIRHMSRNKYGRIVNISSVVGLTGNAGQVNYSASKAGVVGFTKSVAKEYASRGITCNAIAPGFIETDMTRKMADAARDAMLGNIPMKRPGFPEDVAKVAAFLASDESEYVTGEVIRVDGGMCM